MAATAEEKAVSGRKAKTSSFSTTPTAAEATRPMALMTAVIIRKEMLTKAS